MNDRIRPWDVLAALVIGLVIGVPLGGLIVFYWLAAAHA